MEFLLYTILTPALVIIVSTIFGLTRMNVAIGPSIVFFLLSLPAVISKFSGDNVGYEAIFGWALFFSIITLAFTLVLQSAVKTKQAITNSKTETH